MATTITATRQVVEDYQRLFVNRRATRCSPCGRTRKLGGTTTSGQAKKEQTYP